MDFYVLSKKAALAPDGEPVELQPVAECGDVWSNELLDGSGVLARPIELLVTEGEGWGDYHEIRYPQGLMVSARVVSSLRESGCTGWRDYDVRIAGSEARRSGGYRGLAITGMAERLDRTKEMEVRTRTPRGGEMRRWCGYGIDRSGWTGADMFLTRESGGIVFVSERVKRALEALPNLLGVALVAIGEFPFPMRIPTIEDHNG